MRTAVKHSFHGICFRYLGGGGLFDRPIVRTHLAHDTPSRENRGGRRQGQRWRSLRRWRRGVSHGQIASESLARSCMRGNHVYASVSAPHGESFGWGHPRCINSLWPCRASRSEDVHKCKVRLCASYPETESVVRVQRSEYGSVRVQLDMQWRRGDYGSEAGVSNSYFHDDKHTTV